jgi:hypothetical protein
MRTSRMIGMVAAIGLTIATGAAALAYEPAPTISAPQTALTPQTLVTMHHMRKLADAHADICKQNLDSCTNGCGGATSCTNQCQTNYNGCMQNGQ